MIDDRIAFVAVFFCFSQRSVVSTNNNDKKGDDCIMWLNVTQQIDTFQIFALAVAFWFCASGESKSKVLPLLCFFPVLQGTCKRIHGLSMNLSCLLTIFGELLRWSDAGNPL